MSVRLYNGRICTMENGIDIIEGELWVKKNRIAYAGPAKPPEMSFNREIDLHGNLVMPGFKNAHTHSAMTFLRSFADDMKLQEWLEHQIFPMEARLMPEYCYYFNVLAIMEYLSSGITSVMDMYIYPEEMVQASISCGFRTVITGAVSDYVMSLGDLEEEYLRYNETHELISATLGFHAEYTSSESLIKGVGGLAHKYRAPVYCHNSETLREVEECVRRHGLTPTQYLDRLGCYEYGGGGYHCVHVNERDMDIMNKRGVSVVTNPASNCKLASGVAPLGAMMGRGINIALGTDGPASNNCLDMFREMFLVTALQKVINEDPAALPAKDVLEMATKNGAKAMGLMDCDSLAPGKLADLIVIDLTKPNMHPQNNILHNLVYSGSKQNIKMTMVNGKILYEDGNYNIGYEPGELYTTISKIMSNMI